MGFQKKYDSVKSLFHYNCLLNLENLRKIMWKLVNIEQSECIQMKYHLQEINALNKK